MENSKTLDNILVAQVLILAKHIKAEKAAKGTTSTSDYTSEAIRLISQKKDQILEALL